MYWIQERRGFEATGRVVQKYRDLGLGHIIVLWHRFETGLACRQGKFGELLHKCSTKWQSFLLLADYAQCNNVTVIYISFSISNDI